MRLTPSQLKPGDVVELELGRDPKGRLDGFPRWIEHEDRGPTGVWQRAQILDVTSEDVCLVQYVNPVTHTREVWPFPGLGFTDGRPGWPRELVPRRCECGALKVYGGGPHSHWCPMYDERAGV
jgi:hypothetical protein